MTESFENLDNILPDWAKENIEKVLSRLWTDTRSSKNKEKHVSLKKMTRKKYSSSVSRD